jgi:hypothetical protein
MDTPFILDCHYNTEGYVLLLFSWHCLVCYVSRAKDWGFAKGLMSCDVEVLSYMAGDPLITPVG